MIFESSSPAQTLAIAKKLGAQAAKGDVYCLSGELGAGKTVFAKGFAKGLGVKTDVTSPTFCIVNEYAGRITLYHFDVYRIESVDEMENIGYIEYFYGTGVCLVEWGEQFKELLPKNTRFISIKKIDENTRNIEIKGLKLNDNTGD